MSSFSERHGFHPNRPITFRHDAPEGLRHAIVLAAYEHLSYREIRSALCSLFMVAPDKSNWSEIPNIQFEVNDLIDAAAWYEVYDAVEELYRAIERAKGPDRAHAFGETVDRLFQRSGAGWRWDDSGGVLARGDELFEKSVDTAAKALSVSGYTVAAKEIREAISDLSRRPEPDLTGAVHHALGALEATGRYIDGSERGFSDLVDRLDLPKPLDSALKKMWGFSSNYGRHVSVTKVPTPRDAALIVHLAAAFCAYLVDDNPK